MKFAKRSLTTGAITMLGWVTLLNAQPAPTAPALAKPDPSVMATRATEMKAQVEADNRHVLHLQTLARKEKDVIKLTCVNDKMVVMRAETNLFDESQEKLTHALASSSDDRYVAYDEADKKSARIHALRGEADACVGETELSNTEESNSFDHPPIVDDPTNTNPFDDNSPGLEPPGYASPFH